MNQAKEWDEYALERRALAGGAFYVERIERDPEHRRLVFYLSLVPEPSVKVIRILTFTDVENLQEYWDEEEDPNFMESIMGLRQQPCGTGFNYVIALEEFEIHFYSETKPTLEDL